MRNLGSKKARVLKIIGTVVGVLLLAVIVFSKAKHVLPLAWGMHNELNLNSGLVLSGYDVVSYHVDQKAAVGSEKFQTEWAGATWQFVNAENKSSFEATPEKYAPQFGGYCAFAVSKGFTANSNPEVWHLENGQLYVFDSESVRDEWVAEISNGVIAECKVNWNS